MKSLRMLGVGVAVVLSAVLVAGCNRQVAGPPTSQVTGSVTLDQQPVEGATVFFQPKVGQSEMLKPAQAVTDAMGNFHVSLTLADGSSKQGMVPGEYDVTVTKLDTSQLTSMQKPPQSLLPARYGSQQTSELSATVEETGPNAFSFKLTN